MHYSRHHLRASVRKIWFIHDRLLKFYSYSYKNMQNDGIYAHVWGIVGLLRVRAKQCTSTPSLQNGCIFGSQDAWFYVPMLLSADTSKHFLLGNQIKLTIEAGYIATDSTSWDYPACTRDTLWRQHYVRTSKEYLINCHIFWTMLN